MSLVGEAQHNKFQKFYPKSKYMNRSSGHAYDNSDYYDATNGLDCYSAIFQGGPKEYL